LGLTLVENVFKTNICTIEPPAGYQIYFEAGEDASKSYQLFLNDHGNALAILDAFSGSLHPELHTRLLHSISRDVTALAAYLEPFDEDFPDEIGYVFEDHSGRHAHRHIFRDSNNGIVLHLTMLENYNDSDIENYRAFLSEISFEDEYNLAVIPGDSVAFEVLAPTVLVTVGHRIYWDNLTKVLSQVKSEG